jgi:ABC-type Fe3+/spermidine/putrescine transport system ATPase subunit
MTIELRDVTFRVGAETHIYRTSLALEAGGFNILLGTTLSGKTTLMRLMAGLERLRQTLIAVLLQRLLRQALPLRLELGDELTADTIPQLA